jgi:hypothetical protein
VISLRPRFAVLEPTRSGKQRRATSRAPAKSHWIAKEFAATMRSVENDDTDRPNGARLMTIRLTADIEKGLVEQAGRMGTSPEALAIEALRSRFAPPSTAGAEEQGAADRVSLADLLGDFIGCIASEEHVPGGAHLSKDTGNQFAEGLLEKRRQGRL